MAIYSEYTQVVEAGEVRHIIYGFGKFGLLLFLHFT